MVLDTGMRRQTNKAIVLDVNIIRDSLMNMLIAGRDTVCPYISSDSATVDLSNLDVTHRPRLC